MKIDRLLEIVILLLNRESVTAREMAEHFGVSVRTIQRDMVSIALSGVPLYSQEGKNGGYAILPEYRLNSQTMRREDYIWVARALGSLATSYSGYPLESLAEKFNALAGRYDAPHIYWDLGVTKENMQVQKINGILESAAREQRLVRFRYRNADGAESEKTVQPLAIHYKWYAWYAFCYEPEKERYITCKSARMMDVQTMEERCGKDHGDIRARMLESEQAYYATCVPIDLRFAPEKENLMAEYFPDCPAQRLSAEESRIIVNVPLKERLWKALILSFGDQVRVAYPHELAEELRMTAQGFLNVNKEL